MKLAVLGGGITGLVATHLLLEAGHDVTCFEAGDRCGGLCQSEVVDGFVADRAGGHIIFSKDQEVLQFLLGLLESEGGYHTSKRDTVIHLRDRKVQYPFENGLGDLAKPDTFVCLRDYLEAQFQRRLGAGEPQNFGDWCRWRFGEGICQIFMHPYNEKIWNIPLNELGIQWVSGRIPDAPMDDVLRSALGIRTEGYVHQSVFHYPNRGGFESLIKGLVRRIPSSVIRTRHPVKDLRRMGTGWSVDGVAFDDVISTIPMPLLAKVLQEIPPDVAESFAALDSTSLMTVFLALNKSDPPSHSWVYFPDMADGPQNRITWLSNYAPQNAPAGCASIMAEVTYYRTPPADDETVVEQVVTGLTKGGFFRREELRWAKVWHNRFAYILYRHRLEEHLQTIRTHCESLGLGLAGRFGNYSYYNSDMCVRSAMDLVKERFATR